MVGYSQNKTSLKRTEGDGALRCPDKPRDFLDWFYFGSLFATNIL